MSAWSNPSSESDSNQVSKIPEAAASSAFDRAAREFTKKRVDSGWSEILNRKLNYFDGVSFASETSTTEYWSKEHLDSCCCGFEGLGSAPDSE